MWCYLAFLQSPVPGNTRTRENTTFRAKQFLNSCITASKAGYCSGASCATLEYKGKTCCMARISLAFVSVQFLTVIHWHLAPVYSKTSKHFVSPPNAPGYKFQKPQELGLCLDSKTEHQDSQFFLALTMFCSQ